MSQSLSIRLRLRINRSKGDIIGINGTKSTANGATGTHFKSAYNCCNYSGNCLIVSQITENIPAVSFNKEPLQIPSGMQLADPSFHHSGEMNILLGANVFW